MKTEKRLERLNPRLRHTYDAVKSLEALGAPPSVREIVRRMGLEERHVSRVHGDLKLLERAGLIEKLPIPTRCFSAVGPPAAQINWEEVIRSIG